MNCLASIKRAIAAAAKRGGGKVFRTEHPTVSTETNDDYDRVQLADYDPVPFVQLLKLYPNQMMVVLTEKYLNCDDLKRAGCSRALLMKHGYDESDLFSVLRDCYKSYGSPLKSHINRVRAIAATSDGKLITVGTELGRIRVWDAAHRVCNQSFTLYIPFDTISVVDHTTIIVGTHDRHDDEDTVALVDTSDGRCLRSIHGKFSAMTRLVDGRIVTGYQYKMLVWDMRNGTNYLIPTINHSNEKIECLYQLTDGRLAASMATSGILFWDVDARRRVRTIHTPPNAAVCAMAQVSSGGHLAVVGRTNVIRLYDTSPTAAIDQELVRELKGHKAYVTSLSTLKDGVTLASGSQDRTVRLWDTITGVCLCVLRGHTEGVTAVATLSDGVTVASGSYDGTVRLWRY
jgi:WD40 repeat protein